MIPIKTLVFIGFFFNQHSHHWPHIKGNDPIMTNLLDSPWSEASLEFQDKDLEQRQEMERIDDLTGASGVGNEGMMGLLWFNRFTMVYYVFIGMIMG